MRTTEIPDPDMPDDNQAPARDTGAAARLAKLLPEPFPREEINLDDVAEVLALLDAARGANAALSAELAGQRVAAKEARMLSAARFAVAQPSDAELERIAVAAVDGFADVSPDLRDQQRPRRLLIARAAMRQVLGAVRLVQSRSADLDDWQDVHTRETVIRAGQAAPAALAWSDTPDIIRRAHDVLEGLEGVDLPGAMPVRVAKLKRAADAALEAASARRPASLTLTAHQLGQALEFATGEPYLTLDEEVAGNSITLGHLSDVKDDNGADLPPGLFCWLTDYPEEGYHGPLEEEPVDEGEPRGAVFEVVDGTKEATDATVEACTTLGLLVGYDMADEYAEALCEEHRIEFAEWARALHFYASDNAVDVPARPDWLPEPWQGEPEGFGRGPTPLTLSED